MIFEDFKKMLQEAQKYLKDNNFKAVLFNNDQYFGVTCLNNGKTWKMLLTTAFESINNLNDIDEKELFINALINVIPHRSALLSSLTN